MNELTVMDFNGIEVTDSRQVAEAFEKTHKNLLQDIRKYCGYLGELNFQPVDFFIESTYTDPTGRTLPCYLCTKKGCEGFRGWCEVRYLYGFCRQTGDRKIEIYRKNSRKPRMVHGRHPERRPRQCVFLGTTNNYDFLKDETGDRRYYPIDVDITKAVKNIDKDLTPEYIGQIWAEAFYLYQNNTSIYIQDKNILAMTEYEQQKHFDESPLQSDILNFLDIPVTKNWNTLTLIQRQLYIAKYEEGKPSDGTYVRDKISVKEIACELYGYELSQPIERRFSLEIARSLTALGWRNTGKMERLAVYGKQRTFCK